MAKLTFRDARTSILRSMQAVDALIVATNSIPERKRLLSLYNALHRELAAIDIQDWGQSTEEYRAITVRFSGAKADLENAKKSAQKLAKNLGIAANVIDALAKLAVVL
jgi:hypothetical protein